MSTTYPQGSNVKAKDFVSFKVNGKGRAVTLKPTDKLWVTNPQHAQNATGFVMVGRPNHHIGQGYGFTQAQFAELFTVEG